MINSVDVRLCIIIPNWDGVKVLKTCLDSLMSQSLKAHIIMVDNGSVDGSVELVEKKYPSVEIIRNDTNLGFAEGVNCGFRRALDLNAGYIAAFNNDAFADPDWLKNLEEVLEMNNKVGVVTSKILSLKGDFIDSTGDYYTNWGLPYPRGRGETELNKYDTETEIFAASGGASLYRASMLKQIGLFDKDFFAYYEDVDLSFRAHLSGWKVAFNPKAIVYHQISMTSNRMKGFSTYQTMKNQPLLLMKNVPGKYLFRVGWRFLLAHTLFFIRAVQRGQGWIAFKGDYKGTILLFTGFKKRRYIQKNKKVSDEYIWSIFIHDLPPNASALRKLRSIAWKLRFKKS
jgi:GT2 family glycosyltransferase